MRLLTALLATMLAAALPQQPARTVLHREQPGIDGARLQGGRPHRYGLRRRVLDVRPEHPRARMFVKSTTAADLLGEKDRLGRLAPGLAADIVAIEGKPLENITDVVIGVRWVMKDGLVVVGAGEHPRPGSGR